MPQQHTLSLDQGIQRIEAHLLSRLNKLKTLRTLLDSDPTLITELRAALWQDAKEEDPDQPNRIEKPVDRSCVAPISPSKEVSNPQVDALLAWFKANHNDLASVRDISEETGLTRNTVNAILYTSKYRHLFKYIRLSPKQTLWQVKEYEWDTSVELDELAEMGIDFDAESGD